MAKASTIILFLLLQLLVLVHAASAPSPLRRLLADASSSNVSSSTGTAAPQQPAFTFHEGAESSATSECSRRSLTFCEEAFVKLGSAVVGRAYETVDPLTWSGDSAPGYMTKRSYSKAIGSAGVVRTLRAAFVSPSTDAGSLSVDVCTSTGAIWHYMQATIQVFGAKAPDRCSAVATTWQSIAYTATTTTITSGDTSSEQPASTSTGSSLLNGLGIAILVVVCVILMVVVASLCGKEGLDCLAALCRICYNA
jgi:hypothetical protein